LFAVDLCSTRTHEHRFFKETHDVALTDQRRNIGIARAFVAELHNHVAGFRSNVQLPRVEDTHHGVRDWTGVARALELVANQRALRNNRQARRGVVPQLVELVQFRVAMPFLDSTEMPLMADPSLVSESDIAWTVEGK
jgi:hypothetical protein